MSRTIEPPKSHILHVAPAARGERLDRWLAAQVAALSRSQVTRLLSEGAITVDGSLPHKAGLKLAGGEQVVVTLSPAPPTLPQAETMALTALYEDEDVLVLDKAAGLVIHPAPGHSGGTLLNALLARLPDLPARDPEQAQRPGIVHRLDRDTSGVLIVAKHGEARRFLQRQFRRRDTEKHYLALVLGQPPTARGTVEGPIGRHPTHRQKRAVVPTGRPATTHYETVESFPDATLLSIQPLTGRTHQIRVHLEAIGTPVAGDLLYGPKRRRIPALERHFLHAARLTVTLPSGEPRTFEAALPAELERVLAGLRGAGLP